VGRSKRPAGNGRSLSTAGAPGGAGAIGASAARVGHESTQRERTTLRRNRTGAVVLLTVYPRARVETRVASSRHAHTSPQYTKLVNSGFDANKDQRDGWNPPALSNDVVKLAFVVSDT